MLIKPEHYLAELLAAGEKPATAPLPVADPHLDPEHYPGEGYRVTLFNDEVHTLDEVVGQLMLALNCTPDVAVHITLRAHSHGSATVIIAEQSAAEQVASVLRQIALKVSVDPI